MADKTSILELLDSKKITYSLIEHAPVFTVAEADALDFPAEMVGSKNLFLRDKKDGRFFLILTKGDKHVDLKKLKQQLLAKTLTFATPEHLEQYLGLYPGAVSPFGILNDEARGVEVLIDEDLRNVTTFGAHPNTNNATLILSICDIVKIIEDHGNSVAFLEF